MCALKYTWYEVSVFFRSMYSSKYTCAHDHSLMCVCVGGVVVIFDIWPSNILPYCLVLTFHWCSSWLRWWWTLNRYNILIIIFTVEWLTVNVREYTATDIQCHDISESCFGTPHIRTHRKTRVHKINQFSLSHKLMPHPRIW